MQLLFLSKSLTGPFCGSHRANINHKEYVVMGMGYGKGKIIDPQKSSPLNDIERLI